MTVERAEVVEIPGLEWDGGAPMPVLIATDYRVLFACYQPSEPESVVMGEFVRCSSVRLGLPNDEVLHGHPCGADLRGYRVHSIIESSWLADLRQIESVHDQSARHPIQQSKHFFLVFHDCSIEAIATEIEVRGTYESMALAVGEMVALANLT